MPKLCEYKNCSKQASLRRVDHKKEDMSYKTSICTPIYRYPNENYLSYCLLCKKNSMVKNKQLKICKCGKTRRPRFKYPNDNSCSCCGLCKEDNKPLYCKKEGMIDIKSKKCDCGDRIPSYGFINDHAVEMNQ